MTFLFKLNKSLLILPIMIFSLSLVTILSVYPQVYLSHISAFLISLFFYFLFIYVDFDIQIAIWKIWYFIATVLLFLLHFFATPILGATRWINLGIFNFQPSELAKISLILFSANFLSVHDISKPLQILKFFAYIFPLIILTLLQPDLGTSLVMIFIVFLMLLFSKFPKVIFVLGFSILGIVSSPLWHSLHDYQKDRILVLINPDLDVAGKSYNIRQSLIAIGSGGLWGKGFGKGTQSSLRFLPSFWTDFIFASFSEEWGFIGAVTLILLYFFLLLTILKIAYVSNSVNQKFFALGVFGMLFFQFFVNVGMNLGLLPVTGITFPLMSYGGTSNVVTMSLLGMLQSIWLRHKS